MMMSYLEKTNVLKLCSFKEATSQTNPHNIVKGLLAFNMKVHIFNILNQKALFKVRAVLN